MYKIFRYGFNLILITIVMNVATVSHAEDIKRSEDFSVFWSQVRTAYLNEDVDALDTLSLSTTGLPFRYDSLDPSNTCEREVLKAYIKAKLDFFYSRPGGITFREFLENTPKLDLDTHPEVSNNGIGEYSVGLKVRFAKNNVDGAWDIVDMLDDLDRVYSFSKSAGGPESCS